MTENLVIQKYVHTQAHAEQEFSGIVCLPTVTIMGLAMELGKLEDRVMILME